MSTPFEVGFTTGEAPTRMALEPDEVMDDLAHALDQHHYVQLAERRSQLEDAETLRRVRAL